MSDLGWQDIFPYVTGDPVPATPAVFEELSLFFTQVGRDTEDIAIEFDKLTGDNTAVFEGQAAEAFKNLVEDLSKTLRKVSPGTDEAASRLALHATRLGEIRSSVNTALALANTRWQSLKTAESNAAAAEARHQRACRNDNFFTDLNDPLGEERQTTGPLRDNALSRFRVCEQTVATAEADLALSRTAWFDLEAEYGTLDSETDRWLNDIRLGDMSDPSLLSQVGSGLIGFVGFVAGEMYGFVESVVKMVDAALDGRWADAFYHLSDGLGHFLTLAGIAGLFLSFTPFGAGLILIAAGAKLLIDSGLMMSGETHPETGESITWGDLAWDAFTVGAAGIGYAGARNAAAGNAAAQAAGTTSRTRPWQFQTAMGEVDLLLAPKTILRPVRLGTANTVNAGFTGSVSTAQAVNFGVDNYASYNAMRTIGGAATISNRGPMGDGAAHVSSYTGTVGDAAYNGAYSTLAPEIQTQLDLYLNPPTITSSTTTPCLVGAN